MQYIKQRKVNKNVRPRNVVEKKNEFVQKSVLLKNMKRILEKKE